MSALALRFAWRELRGGLRGFGVFVACIVLGVMAIAGVGSVAKSLSDGLSSAGRVILGGDLAFSLVQREASGEEQAFLGAHGVVSVAATLPTMARTDDGRAALVEIKAVDGAYPLFGAVATNPAMPLPALFARQGDAFGAAVDPALLSRLDLKPGDRIAIGNAAIELRAVLTGEPDKLAGGIGFGPRVLISEAALRASGLLQPGSIVRWQYRLRLPDREASDGAVASVEKAARSAHPNAGWDIRTRSKASPQLERNVERFSQYLTLVALTALLVGGVGVANAVASHLARKRDSIGDDEGAWGDRRRRLCRLLHADCAGCVVCYVAWRGARRGAAVRDRKGVRLAYSAARRALALSKHARPLDRLRHAHGSRLCPVAARTGP